MYYAGMPVSTEAEAVAAARQLQARQQAARDGEAATTADGRSHEGRPSARMSVLVKRGAAGCTLVPPDGGESISQAAFPVDKVRAGYWHLSSMLCVTVRRVKLCISLFAICRRLAPGAGHTWCQGHLQGDAVAGLAPCSSANMTNPMTDLTQQEGTDSFQCDWDRWSTQRVPGTASRQRTQLQSWRATRRGLRCALQASGWAADREAMGISHCCASCLQMSCWSICACAPGTLKLQCAMA